MLAFIIIGIVFLSLIILIIYLTIKEREEKKQNLIKKHIDYNKYVSIYKKKCSLCDTVIEGELSRWPLLKNEKSNLLAVHCNHCGKFICTSHLKKTSYYYICPICKEKNISEYIIQKSPNNSPWFSQLPVTNNKVIFHEVAQGSGLNRKFFKEEFNKHYNPIQIENPGILINIIWNSKTLVYNDMYTGGYQMSCEVTVYDYTTLNAIEKKKFIGQQPSESTISGQEVVGYFPYEKLTKFIDNISIQTKECPECSKNVPSKAGLCGYCNYSFIKEILI